MMVANVTAVQNGETVLDHEDASDADLSSLIQFGEEIVIHEVHDEDELESVKNYAVDDDWDETVVFDDDGDDEDDSDDEFAEASVGESGECLHADCDASADVSVKCDTGQIKHYCDDHSGGRRAGIALAVEKRPLVGGN